MTERNIAKWDSYLSGLTDWLTDDGREAGCKEAAKAIVALRQDNLRLRGALAEICKDRSLDKHDHFFMCDAANLARQTLDA